MTAKEESGLSGVSLPARANDAERRTLFGTTSIGTRRATPDPTSKCSVASATHASILPSGVRAYYEHNGIAIIHGDCREILPSISVDAIVTDPPYGVGFRGEVWDESIPAWWLPLARACAPLVVFTTAPTTMWDYPRPDGVLCSARPGSTSRTPWGGFNHWTPVLVYGRGKWSPDFHSQPDCLRVNDNAGIDHPCPKSLALMRWIVAGTNGLILDPFMGSGTTLRAAKDLSRRAIGIEIEERYCEIAAKRLAQEVLPFGEKL